MTVIASAPPIPAANAATVALNELNQGSFLPIALLEITACWLCVWFSVVAPHSFVICAHKRLAALNFAIVMN